MKVRTYLIFLILGYSICALTVFYLLNSIHRGEAQLSNSVYKSKMILRDLEGLERNFSHWMLLSDLVLGADESYLADGAIRLGDEVGSILQTMSTEIPSRYRADVLDIQNFSSRQKDRLLKSRTLNGPDRQSCLDELLTQLDAESNVAISSLENLKNKITSLFEHNKDLLNESLSNRYITIRILLLAFLGCAMLLWLWISSIVSQPISMLAQQSRINLGSDRNFKLKPTAPDEVKQLASSFSELVNDLEYQIDEHQKTQIERTRLHHKLMEASRRAGMADVASEVLHNVGNVLNSMNVSATVIRSSLKNSMIPKLAIANTKFSEHADDYGSYLDEDEKGKHFPAALDYMADSLMNERDAHMDETEQLLRNISHVRNVIQRQLSLSRDDGVIEKFCLLDLIEECIQINNDKAKRIRALVTFSCPETLNLETDRHKLQQILINLISNSLDAVEDNITPSRRVEVIVNNDDKKVSIDVKDNGIGIPPENLTKIFSQGFTTKENGHGFGLHSCSLTAKVLGGTLNVSSEGLRRGSHFQLVIPLSQTELCKV